VIISPRYPDLYPNYLKCGYNIKAPAFGSITITFYVLDIEFHQNCIYDFISVSDVYNTVNYTVAPYQYRYVGDDLIWYIHPST